MATKKATPKPAVKKPTPTKKAKPAKVEPPKEVINNEAKVEVKVDLGTNAKVVEEVKSPVAEPVKEIAPIVETKTVIEEKKVEPVKVEEKKVAAKTFDEFVIKEIMHQKGVNRDKAIEILSNPLR